MTRRSSVIVGGSLAVHAIAAMLLLTVDRTPHEAPRAPVSIGLVEVAPPSTAPTTTPVTATPGPRGGSSASKKVLVASRARRAGSKSAEPRSDGDPRGAITFDNGAGDPAGTGTGTGTGRGTGAGIGFGDGGAISQPPTTLVAPAPPPASKARPARLIFPSRQREVDDGELFVMKVTVDKDGFVAGARLVRGFGGRRDEVASDQIWRFRYDPALDDDGKPIVSTVEQRFLVQ